MRQRFTVRRVALHPETIRHRTPMSPEIMWDPAMREYRAAIVDEAIDHAHVQIEREVYRGTLPAARTRREFEVSVPYAAGVVVDLPRRWWERLLRRPARTVVRNVAGTVKARGHVVVDIGAEFRFPEFTPTTGPGVPTGAVVVDVSPPRLWFTDQHPTSGPHAVMARTAMSCPGCGHYWSSHEAGACLTTDCDCTDQPPRARGGAQWI
jgi:hypothetical protein